MIFFKLSWLPYILIIGGIFGAIEGEPAALIMTAIGGVWLYFKYSNKNKSSNQSGTAGQTYTPNPGAVPQQKVIDAVTVKPVPQPPVVKPAPQPPVTNPVSQPTPEPVSAGRKFCCYCGAKVEPDDVYCVECGEKL